MWDNTGSPKWKASSTMTPNKVVSQFDPAIILSGSKAIKNDMKLKNLALFIVLAIAEVVYVSGIKPTRS